MKIFFTFILARTLVCAHQLAKCQLCLKDWLKVELFLYNCSNVSLFTKTYIDIFITPLPDRYVTFETFWLMGGSNRQAVKVQPFGEMDFNNCVEEGGFTGYSNPGCCCTATVLADGPLYDCNACLLVLITSQLQAS